MELFKENPQRTVFWIGFSIVVLLLIVFGVYAFLNVGSKTEEKTEKKDTSAVQLFPSEEEIEEAIATLSINGKVTKKTDTEITIAAKKETVTLNITKNSEITKGANAAPTTLAKLAGGTTVTAAYNSKTNELINLWWSK